MKIRLLLKKAAICLLLLSPQIQLVWAAPQVSVPQGATAMATTLLPGQSATMLPSGRWLLLGGEGKSGATSTASIQDPLTGAVTTLKTHLLFARAWHSATLLPDGRMIVVGGVGLNTALVQNAEIFDPTFETPGIILQGLLPRAHHTATLLTDGRVLVAGGVGTSGSPLGVVELWDRLTSRASVQPIGLGSERRDHVATLLPDGAVLLWGGKDAQGNPLPYADLYDVDTQSFTSTSFTIPTTPDMNLPYLEDSMPADGAAGIPTSLTVGLRFSKVLQVQTVNSLSVTLSGPSGEVVTKVVPAEGGRLGFVTPISSLQPGSLYLLTIDGPMDSQGLLLVHKSISFTTAVAPGASTAASAQTNPQSTSSSAGLLSPLQAPLGVTALSGQALLVNGQPLANVTISIGQQKTRSDRTGRFLLQHVESGHQVFVIEGGSANYSGNTFGLFEVGTDIKAGITNVLGYKVWMTPLDTAHAISIPSPTLVDTIVTTSALPGLKLDLPPQTVIYDHYGHVVHQLTITPIRLDRPPFPIPQGLNVTFYFSIQPGGSYLRVGGATYPRGARLIYPNARNVLPGTAFSFWNYDPDQKGWFVYGMGRVSPDRKEVIPDQGVSIYEFTGAMDGGPNSAQPSGTPPGGAGGGGDPVDASTGLFVYKHADFYLPDVIPIDLTRTYRQGDTASRAFGIGTTVSYDIFPVGDRNPYSYLDLVLPDGGRIHYYRISSGTSFSNAVFQHTATPTRFYGSTIVWNPTRVGWDLHFKDGTLWAFPDGSQAVNGAEASLLFIQDRYGNTLNVSRDSNTGNITQITSPNGRWLQFTYDTCNRIQQITDNLGRLTKYNYDSNVCTVGHLQSVIDQNGGQTTFGYQGATIDQMTSITDARQIEYLQNIYDSNDRVHQQILANQGTYTFDYTTDGNGNVTQTNLTDPNGNVRQLTFSAPEIFESGFQTGGYLTSDTYALGKPEQQTFTYNLGASASNPGNFVQSVKDPLGRTTAYTYDALGNRTSVTKLSGTSSPATTSYTFESKFNRLASVTDPLHNTTTLSYNDPISQILVSDPLGNQWTVSQNALGQVLSWTDPVGDNWKWGYSGADLATVTDALNKTTTYIYDGVGRRLSMTDAIGEITTFTYDGLNNRLTITDPLGEVTQYGYDQNSNLTSVTDPKNTSTPTKFIYDNMDHVKTRTGALGNSDSYAYDLNGNLTCHTDRKGQITVFSYDGINRKKSAGFGAATCASTTFQNNTAYTYDGGNHLKSAVDSIAGTISRNYDGLDDVTYENTPQGTVNYTFDSSRRRSSMTVTGQPQVIYGYDAANNLKQITQGSTAIGLTYDSVGRRSSLILPNAITVGYFYDSDSHTSGITYQDGATTLGNLTYSYDALGRRTQVSGSFAGTNVPASVGAVLYNAANQITTWAGTSVTYDLDGNLQNDGTNTYSWDLRNHLSAISGGSTASLQYDGLGKRIAKTINGTATAFLYDGPNIVQELSGSTPTANLISGLSTDEVFARTDSNGARYFLSDALGSTLALTTASATVSTQYTYEPFGSTTAAGASSSNAFEYTGRERDGTGLYFYRARYYKPGFERFASEDPIGFRGGVNLFGYVSNNPINLRDRFGLKPGGGCDSSYGGMTTFCNLPPDCSPACSNPSPSPQPPPPPTPPYWPPLPDFPPASPWPCSLDNFCVPPPPPPNCAGWNATMVTVGFVGWAWGFPEGLEVVPPAVGATGSAGGYLSGAAFGCM